MENKSEREDHDDVGDHSDGEERSGGAHTRNFLMKIAKIDTIVSEGCVCSKKISSVVICGIMNTRT